VRLGGGGAVDHRLRVPAAEGLADEAVPAHGAVGREDVGERLRMLLELRLDAREVEAV